MFEGDRNISSTAEATLCGWLDLCSPEIQSQSAGNDSDDCGIQLVRVEVLLEIFCTPKMCVCFIIGSVAKMCHGGNVKVAGYYIKCCKNKSLNPWNESEFEHFCSLVSE